MMKQYMVTLTGETDLILHRDNINFSSKIKEWQKDPGNKKMTVPGDDRTPAWSWLSCLYTYNGKLVIEADNLMAVLRDGGKKTPATVGRGSMKAQTQSGIIVDQFGWDLIVAGNTIDSAPLMALIDEPDFAKHEQAAADRGFELFVKRARVGTSKHVRVRPRFRDWQVAGTVTVVDDTINAKVLQSILTVSGAMCGLGDWRPSSPTPGQFGRFTADIKEL